MISTKFLGGRFGVKTIGAKNSSFEIFESTSSMKSLTTPLSKRNFVSYLYLEHISSYTKLVVQSSCGLNHSTGICCHLSSLPKGYQLDCESFKEQ